MAESSDLSFIFSSFTQQNFQDGSIRILQKDSLNDEALQLDPSLLEKDNNDKTHTT